MSIFKHQPFCACVLGCLIVITNANAQWAVIDVGAIAELVEEVATMADQLSTAQNHLRQAQQEFQSMTGGRGMERLLSGTTRNYLPSDWTELDAAVRQVSGSYQALSSGVQDMINANAVLTPQQVAALSQAEREKLEQARRTAAMLQVTARQALANTSSRFTSIQQLIDAIPGAQDQKAILDLQARISAEQGMLANEQTKLQVLYQVAQAEELARQQRTREQAVSDVGSLRQLPAMGL
jgi:type IV secretion system protein VirB5